MKKRKMPPAVEAAMDGVTQARRRLLTIGGIVVTMLEETQGVEARQFMDRALAWQPSQFTEEFIREHMPKHLAEEFGEKIKDNVALLLPRFIWEDWIEACRFAHAALEIFSEKGMELYGELSEELLARLAEKEGAPPGEEVH